VPCAEGLLGRWPRPVGAVTFAAVRSLSLVLLAMNFASGCSCSGDLEGGGPTPYLRCTQMDPPDARDVTMGATRLEVIEREVIIHAALPIRIVLARGPAGAGEPLLPGLDAIEAHSPAMVVLLGDLGDGDGTADASVEALRAALAELTVPVLLLPGGRDDGELVRDVLHDAESEHVIDLSGVRSVHIGPLELVPLIGAPEGRYALSERHCGFGADDIEGIAGEISAPSGLRLVLSTSAPATGDPRTAGIDGAEAGDALIAAALLRVQARGGLYALPEAFVAQPFDGTTAVSVPTGPIESLHLVVPRMLGPASERADGSRQASGVVLLEVSEGGVSVLEVPGG